MNIYSDPYWNAIVKINKESEYGNIREYGVFLTAANFNHIHGYYPDWHSDERRPPLRPIFPTNGMKMNPKSY